MGELLLIPLLGGLLIFGAVVLYTFLRGPRKEQTDGEMEIGELGRMRCPHCRQFVKRGSVICPYCYKDLKTNCPNCGEILDISAAQCRSCGLVINRIIRS